MHHLPVPPVPTARPAPPRPFPNWGVPMLRNVRACPMTSHRRASGPVPGRSHPTRDLAVAELHRLRSRFPGAVVERQGRADVLDLVVYEGWRRTQGTNPARQVRLAVTEHDDGGWTLWFRYLLPEETAA